LVSCEPVSKIFHLNGLSINIQKIKGLFQIKKAPGIPEPFLFLYFIKFVKLVCHVEVVCFLLDDKFVSLTSDLAGVLKMKFGKLLI